MGNQNIVDATQFSVDLEAEVGESLRGGLHYILHLDTLGCHAQQSISNTLHLRYKARNKMFASILFQDSLLMHNYILGH